MTPERTEEVLALLEALEAAAAGAFKPWFTG
jgi:hypothetical protein